MLTGLNLCATVGLRESLRSSAQVTQVSLETSELTASPEQPPSTTISSLIHLLFYNVFKRTFYKTDLKAHHTLCHSSKRRTFSQVMAPNAPSEVQHVDVITSS